MNRFSKSIHKIKSLLAGFIKTEQVITIFENNSKKIDTLKYYQDAGIPSQDLTHEKLGQSTLIFTDRKVNDKEVQAAKAEDALGASLRFLKYQRWQNKS
jgi:hypothetical protein